MKLAPPVRMQHDVCKYWLQLVTLQQGLSLPPGFYAVSERCKSLCKALKKLLLDVQESIRGCDVFLVQPSCPPVNDHLMELLVMIDACKRASARSITAVIPYYGYARADRKTHGRESIAAKLTANLITEAGQHSARLQSKAWCQRQPTFQALATLSML